MAETSRTQPTPAEPKTAADRYTTRVDAIPPALRDRGFVAWVHDAQHPDGSEGGASCCFSQDWRDASRITAALNKDDRFAQACRAQIGEAA